ncbi:MAG TPA: hypothetical protein PKC72_14765 [Chitinophagaceae bacterium]|nr:hypothetical protein [Chitinophagaceae bacterium]
MKRFLVVLILVAGLAAVAFASFNSNKKKTQTEKKAEKKEMKKKCSHSCMFS